MSLDGGRRANKFQSRAGSFTTQPLWPPPTLLQSVLPPCQKQHMNSAAEAGSAFWDDARQMESKMQPSGDCYRPLLQAWWEVEKVVLPLMPSWGSSKQGKAAFNPKHPTKQSCKMPCKSAPTVGAPSQTGTYCEAPSWEEGRRTGSEIFDKLESWSRSTGRNSVEPNATR